MGFEPTVAKGDTRSPGAPDRPLQHLSEKGAIPLAAASAEKAERVGFEPTLAKSETAFRERHHKPLGHLSKAFCKAILAVYVMDIVEGFSKKLIKS